jgi:tetratricopeptide (TPR) repeat protein
MNPKAIKLTLLLSFAIILGVSGQNSSKAIKKANKYYQLRQYAVAIPLYQQALDEKINAGLLYKLGNCYRLTNKTQEAEATFLQLFESGKRIRNRAYLHYSEVLISNGEYEKAKSILSEYLALEPEDSNAKSTLSNIDGIKDITSYYANVELLPFNHNTDADEHGAVFLDDGIVFVSDRKRGVKLFKENAGTTGRDFLSLYQSNRTGRMEYGTPKILPNKINGLNRNTGPASFTKDGKIMVFSQNNHIENNKGELALQLYSAKREDGKWKNIEKIDFCNNSINYMHPAISPDGKMLFFVSDKTKGEGGADLYMSTLKVDGEWSRPENLGPRINTEAHEGFPFFDTNGKLFFCSKGHLGYGGFDIFFSEMDEFSNWAIPTNLGQPINSSQDDISFCMDKEGKYGLFTSSRDGGDDDIFMFRFKKNDMILSVELIGITNVSSISDARIQVIPMEASLESKEMEMSSDRMEMSLDNNQEYEIIISKEGYVPFSQKVSPSSVENNFLQLKAIMIKKL